jgi:hypothetical protein
VRERPPERVLRPLGLLLSGRRPGLEGVEVLDAVLELADEPQRALAEMPEVRGLAGDAYRRHQGLAGAVCGVERIVPATSSPPSVPSGLAEPNEAVVAQRASASAAARPLGVGDRGDRECDALAAGVGPPGERQVDQVDVLGAGLRAPNGAARTRRRFCWLRPQARSRRSRRVSSWLTRAWSRILGSPEASALTSV